MGFAADFQTGLDAWEVRISRKQTSFPHKPMASTAAPRAHKVHINFASNVPRYESLNFGAAVFRIRAPLFQWNPCNDIFLIAATTAGNR
jgi:hypothetical protein